MKLLQKISEIIAEKMPATPEIIIRSKRRFQYSSSAGIMPSKDASYYRDMVKYKQMRNCVLIYFPMVQAMQIIVHSNRA
jgi:hypothetical protein